jgi:hypothetical protein
VVKLLQALQLQLGWLLRQARATFRSAAQSIHHSVLSSVPRFSFRFQVAAPAAMFFIINVQGRMSRCSSVGFERWRPPQPISALVWASSRALHIRRPGRQPLIAESHLTTFDWKSKIFPDFQAESVRDSRSDMDRNIRYEMVSLKFK